MIKPGTPAYVAPTWLTVIEEIATKGADVNISSLRMYYRFSFDENWYVANYSENGTDPYDAVRSGE